VQFDVLVTAFVHLSLHFLDSFFIQINCVDLSLRTNAFSQSECIVACVTSKVNDHLTLSDVGFNAFLWVLKQPFDWVYVYLVFWFLLFLAGICIVAKLKQLKKGEFAGVISKIVLNDRTITRLGIKPTDYDTIYMRSTE
jgi:hypothetical protein